MPIESQLTEALRLHRAGRLSEAEQLYRRVLQSHPAEPKALHLLGVLCYQMARADEALTLMTESVAADPDQPDFHNNLAGLLARMGRAAEAVEHLCEALRLRPDHAQGRNNLGASLEALGRFGEAETELREALRLQPEYPEARYNLGNTLRQLSRSDEAAEQLRLALKLRPGYGEAHHALAVTQEALGNTHEAIGSYRRAVELRPSDPAMHSDLLLALHYHEITGNDPQALYNEHLAWARRHAEPLYSQRSPHAVDDRNDRPLRVGYVSPDFRSHPVARLFAPALLQHDRRVVTAVCYSDVEKPDELTERLRQHADEWYDVRNLSDAQLAEKVRRDRIDILVDLTGHMALKRLLVFARKPAPVQVTCIGYPDTTGLRTIDYRISDSVHDPAGETERYHTEALVRLGPCCWCYDPTNADPAGEASTPAVAPPPADRRAGFVTFACTNRPVKITAPVLALWAQILQNVPHSRLLILADSGSERTLAERCRQQGIDGSRLEFAGRRSRGRFLELHNEFDVLLDTFPYNGHTTTIDALWMGVPTVSIRGRTHVSRAGASVLSAVGFRDLVATSPEGYVETAVALAQNPERLRELRSGLRQRMKSSSLMDTSRFARALEEAFRQMWRRWCEHRTQH